MTREADELATRTVATVQALHSSEDDESLFKASAILLAAVAAARAIGARAAARRFGRQDFTPTPIEPAKHEQIDKGLATCWDAPQALPVMVRSEVVRAAADEFVLESIEIVNEPDFEIDDMEEDPEDLPETYEDDEDIEQVGDYSEGEGERYEDTPDDDSEDDFEEWLKEQDRLYDLWEAEQDRIYDEEERLEAEEEAKRYELPPVKELEKEWVHILQNDPDPCGRCKLAQGRRIKYPQHFKGIHPQCGCVPVLSLVPIRLADKPKKERNKK